MIKTTPQELLTNTSQDRSWIEQYVILDRPDVEYKLLMYVRGGRRSHTANDSGNVDVRFLQSVGKSAEYVCYINFETATDSFPQWHPVTRWPLYVDVPFDAVEAFWLENAQ